MTQTKNLKILIIEDDPTSAFMFRQFLFGLLFKDIHIFSDANSGMEAIRLIKPVSWEDLRQVFEKVQQHILPHNQVKALISPVNRNQLIEINSNKEISFYQPRNVVCIEADGNYSRILLIDGKKDTITQNLGKLADKFSSENFVRVNRKSIVNVNFLRRLNKKSGELEQEFNRHIFKITTSKKYFKQGHSLTKVCL